MEGARSAKRTEPFAKVLFLEQARVPLMAHLRRAEAITRSAAPFGRFNPAMQRKADVIVVISRFKFTRDETLETGLTSN